MFKSIGFKVSATIFSILLISFVVVWFVLNLDFKNTADKMGRENLDTISTSVFQTMRMAMNLGDPEKIKEAIEDARSIKGISDIYIYPSKDTIELFEMKNPQITKDSLILEQFDKPEIKTLEQMYNGTPSLRLIRPLIADDSCVACHANAKNGSVLGVMDVYHSLQSVQDDIARTSRSYILIFSFALLFTLTVVLLVLKKVVGNPVLELLKHAKELAQGTGDLRARIRVKGQDEISQACNYINQFIEKTQNAVISTGVSVKKVEDQTGVLSSNATSLNEITMKSHHKTNESFDLSNSIGSELTELASLSSEANVANDKSYTLLEEMLNSLFNVAQKVNSVATNEGELAKKVENMVKQAHNIQKATTMMDEIADKTNLLSLNAGIEAARAGTFGRGFSVIAEDIRNLVQSSEEFLGSVAQITKELLESIQDVSNELRENAHSVQSLNENANLLVNSANEVKICNQEAKNLVLQCTQKIKISQENIQKLLFSMQETVEVSEKNEEIAKILLQISNELKIMCNNLEVQVNQFQV